MLGWGARTLGIWGYAWLGRAQAENLGTRLTWDHAGSRFRVRMGLRFLRLRITPSTYSLVVCLGKTFLWLWGCIRLETITPWLGRTQARDSGTRWAWAHADKGFRVRMGLRLLGFRDTPSTYTLVVFLGYAFRRT